MMRLNSLQLSLFGNFINIKPNTDIVIKLLTVLRKDEFIPGSTDIANVDIKTGKVTVDSRMQLVSPDKTWSVVFLNERIDFNYNYQEGTPDFANVEPVISKGKKLIEKVFSVFASTTGNRLAVNGRFIIEELSDIEIKSFSDKYTKPLAVLSDNPYAEWSVRFNSKEDIVFDNFKENCNRIIEMSQIEKQTLLDTEVIIKHGIGVLFDINTSEMNGENKYVYSNLLSFTDSTLDFITKVMNEIGD